MNEKKCPFCAEIIKFEAKICKYCKSDLTIFEIKDLINYIKNKKFQYNDVEFNWKNWDEIYLIVKEDNFSILLFFGLLFFWFLPWIIYALFCINFPTSKKEAKIIINKEKEVVRCMWISKNYFKEYNERIKNY